jgi:hypothetical protein
MEGTSDSGASRRRPIGEADKACFLESLRVGAGPEESAAAAGFPLRTFYDARARDRVFRTGQTPWCGR